MAVSRGRNWGAAVRELDVTDAIENDAIVQYLSYKLYATKSEQDAERNDSIYPYPTMLNPSTRCDASDIPCAEMKFRF